tara:strand:- start:361 stop:579 length:219 start_codon:yes stop_codon:yes gene_type:complete
LITIKRYGLVTVYWGSDKIFINGIIDAIPAVSNIPDNSKIKKIAYKDFISFGSKIFFNLEIGLFEIIFIYKK